MKTYVPFSILMVITLFTSLPIRGQTVTINGSQQESNMDTTKSTFEPRVLPESDNNPDSTGVVLITTPFSHNDTSDVPQIVKVIEPKYSEAAARSGLEGRVIVKMWINTDGKIGDVVVLKSDANIFNQPAIDAAKQFVFIPAYINKKPVAGWVAYIFKFRAEVRK